MTANEFLIQHLTEDKKYQEIVAANPGVTRQMLTEWWNEGTVLRTEIARSNQLFNSRKGKEEFAAFEVLKKRGFYEWFIRQPKECYYCGIEEQKLIAIFDNGVISTKRGRGRVLELERKDAKDNQYSPDNCVLACYLCNNHKSDLISESDHIKFFATAVRQYLEAKYKETL